MLLLTTVPTELLLELLFQWAPTLGGECYYVGVLAVAVARRGFNGHPPWGVNATILLRRRRLRQLTQFQWAPTLGGECYSPYGAG